MDHSEEPTLARPAAEVSEALAQMLTSTPAAVVVLQRGRISYANAAADEMLELPGSLVGRDVLDLVHPSEVPGLRRRLALHDRCRLKLPPTSFETDLVRADGRVIRIESLAHTIDSDGARVIGLICCDVTARAAQEEQWLRAATHDPLTGLPNRVLLIDRLETSMARLGRQCAQVLVMLLDLDGFKSVNDTHGHAVGDQLLQQVARRLRGALRAGDTVARLAGDEFVICAELGVASPTPAVLQGRVQAALGAPFQLDGITVTLTAGVGAITLDEPRDVHGVIDEVDRQMYRQKQSGDRRARVQVPPAFRPRRLLMPPGVGDPEGRRTSHGS